MAGVAKFCDFFPVLSEMSRNVHNWELPTGDAEKNSWATVPVFHLRIQVRSLQQDLGAGNTDRIPKYCTETEDQWQRTSKNEDHKALPRLPENLEATARRASAARLLCLDRCGLSFGWGFIWILRWGLLESIGIYWIHMCIYIYRYVYIWGWSIESIGTLSFPTVHRIHLQQNHPAEARLTKCSRLKYILDTRSYSQIWFTQITHDHLSMHFLHNIQVHSHDFVIIRIVSSFGIC